MENSIGLKRGDHQIVAGINLSAFCIFSASFCFQLLRKTLDSKGLQHVRIVAADDFQAEFEKNLARDLLLDPELASSVDIFG